ncbi:hypothetical protein JMJ58_03665 [Haloterrigena salifodinae]|uniref:Uncharacterized protein n=1 Tax=Haloterrigena salifodinae TaxID=2675099 RepID=A0A8T8E397_9EURY|nr:hypothetical protein [Haloterrigena salifodinae]QRV16006.1 hypothetical protein JMJ58_03665 [Haloterrigena salifodinae]
MKGNTNSPPEFDIESQEDMIESVESFVDYYANTSVSGSKKVEAQSDFIDALVEAVEVGIVTIDEIDDVLTRDEIQNKNPLGAESIKTDVKNNISESHLPLDRWLVEHTDEVVVYKSSDTNVDTSYTWKFDSGHQVELGKEVFNWYQFADELHKVSFMFDFQDPREEFEEMGSWKRKFLIPLLQEVAREKEVEGSRSEALEALQNTIRTRRAYDDLEEAYQSSGVYVETYDDPDTVYVLTSQISTIADEYSESRRSLQAEISSKKIARGKVSKKYYLENGQSVRFWKLPTDFAEPKLPDEDEGEEEDSSVSSRGGVA